MYYFSLLSLLMNQLIRSFLIFAFFLVFQVSAHDPGTISVTGRGEVKVEPDQATVNIGVEMRDVSIDQVRQETDSRASAIIAVLKDKGIEDKYIQSSYTNLQPHYPYVDPSSEAAATIDTTKPDYYIAQKTITYILRNISNYDNVMAGLYEAGINRIDDVTFGLEDVEQHQMEARRRAAENAKKVATVITRELGVELSYAYSISESTSGGEPPVVFAARGSVAFGGAAESSSGPSVAGGQVVVSSTVSVNFYTILHRPY